MIGDKLIVKPWHLPPAEDIVSIIKHKISPPKRYFITVGGESGSGKSTLAIAIKEVLTKLGFTCFTIHMDDYFHLPPSSTHHQRLDDINFVGPQEVDLALLQNHIDQILEGKNELHKPLIHYKENEKRIEFADLTDTDVVIIEGTYVTTLNNINTRVFINRDYKDTWEARVERARDPITPFIEDVLAIEHAIIKTHLPLADIIVDKDYNVESV